MIRRVEGTSQPPRKLGVKRRATALVEVIEERDTPELALRYGNGFVTVEISHDALDAYAEMNGDVPLPVYEDEETGDRRTYDQKTRVRLVYDAQARLREVTTRGRDGVYVRLTVSDARSAAADAAEADGAESGAEEPLQQITSQERYDAGGDGNTEVVGEADGEPQGAANEDGGAAGQDSRKTAWI